MSILRDLLTGRDNTTHDLGRWLGAGGGVTGIVMPVYDTLVNHTHFDCQAFGIGMGALAAGVGAMLKLKAETEPPGS